MITVVEEVRGICIPSAEYQLVTSHSKSRCFRKVSTALYLQGTILSNSRLLRENKGQMLNQFHSPLVSHTALRYLEGQLIRDGVSPSESF